MEYLYLPNITHLNTAIGMLENCYNLKNINLSFLKNDLWFAEADKMFKNCISLTKIEFPEIEIRASFTTDEMFSGCINLKYINLEKLKADSVIYIDRMFYNCINLEYLNINNLNTKDVYDADNVFYGVPKSLDLRYNETISCRALKQQINDLFS